MMNTKNYKKVKEVFDFVLVSHNDKYGLLDKQENVLVPCVMDALYFVADFDCCFFEKDGLRGAYSKELGYAAPIYELIEVDGVGFSVVFKGEFGRLDEALKFVATAEDVPSLPALSLKEENLERLEEIKISCADYDASTREYILKGEMEQTIIEESGAYQIYMYGTHML